MSDPRAKGKRVEVDDLPRQEEELTPERAQQAQGGCRKAGGDQQSFLVITMSDVLVSG